MFSKENRVYIVSMLQENQNISEKVKKYLLERGFTSDSSVEDAGSAGSGRKYYRVISKEKSLIIQVNPSANEDFRNYADLSRILKDAKVPVPAVFFRDDASAQLVIEDFGKRSLFDEVFPMQDSKRASASILYDLVVQSLISLQVESASIFSSYPNLAARKFDYESLKWESDYFTENFLKKHCGVKELPAKVSEAFATLACNVDLQPKVLMHRDFQSQNILLLENEMVGFIDFQGMRRGSQYYDLASLLWDPYVQMPKDMVESFFKKWLRDFPGNAGYSDEETWIAFLAASLQRLMQALGAYCFLSKTKGIESFKKYIEPGKKQLLQVLNLYREFSPSSSAEANKYLCSFLET
jgi:aminoglycoside/choline kinase family phosphotransferase